MSAQNHTAEDGSAPPDDPSQFCHPKANRSEAKRAKGRLEKHGPAYPSKNRHHAHVADKATSGDRVAHSFDSDKLCPKLLPVDRHESRGCKIRDMDRRTKAWNKQGVLGLIPGEEDADVGD